MKRVLVGAALAAALTTAAYAQNTTLAPWFDSDGFYNRAGVTFERATNDMLACRVEAARLRVVRNTNSRTPTGAAFDPSGAYDPVVSGVATGIASILFAIQDARYNGSIEHIEFRDCIVALGYRHYRLGRRDRERFNAEPDHGFAALVAAAAPADGRLNESETGRNYFAAAAAPSRYANAAAPAPVRDEPAAATGAPTDPGAPVPVTVAPQGVIQRLAPGEIATAQPGAAIVVIAASQLAGAMENPMAGDTFRFRRVPQDGAFLDLLQPAASFGVRSHINSERRRDATLAGEFRDPRYSTYVIPAGRYVLSDLGTLNACLGTLTFEAREGEVLYLGDFVLRPPSVPIGSVLNPIGNLNSGMDNRLRADLRVGIGDNLEAARAALQAEDAARTRLARVRYENGYRIPCTGRYIGRVANPDWPAFSADQPARFHDAMAAAVAAAQ